MNDRDAGAPLRLALVAGATIPNWLVRCIEAVEQSAAGAFVLVLHPGPEAPPMRARLVQRWRALLFRLYASVDRLVFRRGVDALAPVALRSALPGARVVASGGRAALARTLRQERIDVVVDPFSLMQDDLIHELAPYGVWSTAFGLSGDARSQSSPAFWEVVEGRVCTEARLCVRLGTREGVRGLYVSVTPTDRRSTARSQNHVYWRLGAALTRSIRLLSESPGAFLARVTEAAPFDVVTDSVPPPGNVDVLRACTVLVRRYATDKWNAALHRERWELAYRNGTDGPFDPDACRRIIPPADRLWADPFPVQVGSDYYIFHEELLHGSGNGRLVVTVMDSAGHHEGPMPVLERDHHLAYPCVFQWDGDFFMMPETAARRQVELLRCVNFPLRWELERVVLPDVRAYDPTPAFMFGRWWLFANVVAYGEGAVDELHVFYADSPLGPWTPHQQNPIKSDIRSARPAGSIFERHGDFYRPAQDCSRRYGYAVSINRILRLTPETYEEVEVDKIVPAWGPDVAGVHTYNQVGGLTVIDYLVRHRRLRLAARVAGRERATVGRPHSNGRGAD